MRSATRVRRGHGARTLLRFAAALVAAALPGSAAVAMAQDESPARPSATADRADASGPLATAPDSALAMVLARLPGEPLALEDALALALVSDTAVQAAQARLQAAEASVRRERGVFAPELFGEGEYAEERQPTASFFAGADVLEIERTRAEAGARMRLPLGTELSASLNTVRLTTNSSFATLSPQWDSFGQLALVQPLLRGFGPAARSQLGAAERLRDEAESLYTDVRLTTRADVETTYWALYAAERDLAVQTLIREQAEAFLREAQLRADAGLIGPADVASARVFLAEQAQAALDLEENLDVLSDRLAVLMGRRPAGSAWRYRPLSTPPPIDAAIDQESLVRAALARSPQASAAEQSLAAARTRLRGARWDALPQLDLFGTLGGRGLAGTGREVVIGFGEGPPDTLRNPLDTGFGDSFDQVVSRDFPAWSVGLLFSVPIGASVDRGDRDRLRAQVTLAEQQLEAVRRALDSQVRARARELERGAARLEFASEGVDASLEQVRAGILQFKSGRTTAFELVRLAADLADAQRRYSAALVRTAAAAAELRRLTGGAHPAEPQAPASPGPGDHSSVPEEGAP
ncbi:MAG: TolC family protein [Candidatus Krumholzibacteriia bacterium]